MAVPAIALAQPATPGPAATGEMTRTDTRYVLPYGPDGIKGDLTVTATVEGSCTPHSLASPFRPDAWDCLGDDDQVYDPCFQNPYAAADAPAELACFTTPFTNEVVVLTASGAEENLLGYPGTRYFGVNICVHEFSHGMMNAGIRHADAAPYQAILDAYASAKAADLETVRGYAGNTAGEYWATGVEWFVFANRKDPARLKEGDPTLYALIEGVIPGNRIPIDPYHARVQR